MSKKKPPEELYLRDVKIPSLTLAELRELERWAATATAQQINMPILRAVRELIEIRERECAHHYEPHDQGPPSCSKCGSVLVPRRLT